MIAKHGRIVVRGVAIAAIGAIVAIAGTIGTVSNSIGMQFVEIPAGTFSMGSAVANWDEGPVRQVTISRPFAISKTEVTGKQFRQFRPDFPASTRMKGTGVTWNDAVAFCEWLSKKEGRPYRLPTEAEWEYACRLEGIGDNGRLLGMLDDVVEWCSDWYGVYPEHNETDPVGPAEGLVRVLRGDKLDIDDRVIAPWGYNRPSYRAGMPPSFGRPIGPANTSFRVVQAPPVTTRPRAAELEFFRLGVRQSTSASADAVSSRSRSTVFSETLSRAHAAGDVGGQSLRRAGACGQH